MTDKTISIVSTPLDYNVLRDFLEILPQLDADKGQIDVCISSGGGDMMVAMAMYDAIRGTKNKVRTVGLGNVGSAAVLLFAAGDERVLGPNASLFFHGTSVYAEGSPKNVRTINIEMERVHQLYCSLIAKQSGMKDEEILKFCEKEMYMSANDAVKYGIATGIYKRADSKKK